MLLKLKEFFKMSSNQLPKFLYNLFKGVKIPYTAAINIEFEDGSNIQISMEGK